MKRIATVLSLLLLLFFQAGCRSGGTSSSSAEEVRKWLIDFEASIPSRSADHHYSDTLFTSGGVFVISTQGGLKDAEGLVSLSGESRTSGFFVAPRMTWVSSIEEAERVVMEDLEAGLGLPISAYTSQAEQDIVPNP